MAIVPRISLLELDRDALTDSLAGWGEPDFRAVQLWTWIYRDLARDFKDMTNLPRGLREKLAERATLDPYRLLDRRISEDGKTYKVLLELADEQTIESVLMLYERRRTACLSTQVGCPIRCAFCATGQNGLSRNLTVGEITLQALELARQARPLAPERERPLTHVVYMGMGEPLLNYEAVLRSIRILTDEAGFGLGARRITISTAGVVPGIRRLADEGLQVGLAVSLHAPNDPLRNRLVPLNKRYPIAQVIDSLRYYVERTGRRITFEYAMMAGINDDMALAAELVERIADLPSHVNLIPVNPAEGSPYHPPDRKRVNEFAARVVERGIACTVRLRRGIEVDAGCGQLRSRRLRDALRP